MVFGIQLAGASKISPTGSYRAYGTFAINIILLSSET